MLYACNNSGNGELIKPTFSGERASCRQCGGELTGHCGEIKIWHWQHINQKDCDSWKESETPWHRDWKESFPEKNQEVIIEKNGIKHRADVQLLNGLVLEFQNSPISSSTIKVREKFYEKMIWVINASSFLQNFQRRSVVEQKLREIDDNYDYDIKSIEADYKSDVAKRRDWMWDVEQEIESKRHSYNAFLKKKERIEALISDESLMSQIFNQIAENKYLSEECIDSFLTFELRELRTTIVCIFKEYLEAKERLTKTFENKKEIDSLTEIKYNENGYLITSPNRLRNEWFNEIVAYKKSEKDSLFPEIISFKSEHNFSVYSRLSETFEFAIKKSFIIKYISEKVDDHSHRVTALENILSHLKNALRNFIQEELINQSYPCTKQIEQLETEINELKERKQRIMDGLRGLEDRFREEVDAYQIESQAAIEQRKSEIMTKYKGLYEYNWKHERRSWRAAEKKLYFDTGEGFLYKLIDGEWFKKISKEEFLKAALAKNTPAVAV